MRTKKSTIFCVIALLLFVLAIPQYLQAATIDVRVSGSYDDAEQRVSNGYMSRGNGDLELIHDVSYGDQIVGLRFRNIQIPQGYNITGAYIEFSADETDSTTTDLTISGQAIDDAPYFSSTYYDISNRTQTSASVSWSPEEWTTPHATYRTTELKSIVQEIVNRAGWAAGNDMVFIIEGSGRRVAESYDGYSSKAALLHVEFAAPLMHTITATAGNGGSISPSGPVAVVDGQNQGFTITADVGNSITDVVVDNVSQGAIASYTFTIVTGAHTIKAFFTLPPGECRDIADIPLTTLVKAAPANIMFVLDDSGSMDWEFITSEGDGVFEGKYYVFDDPGDNLPYGSDQILGYSDSTQRLKWKSQWAGYNKMYYDPTTTYDPWPELTDADPNTPRSHPMHSSPTFDLSGTYTSIELGYIIDELDTDKFSKTGVWGDSTSAEAYDSHYYFTNQDDQDITATWTPDLPAGQYEVYAKWYHIDPTRSDAVPYTITYAEGATATVNVNQEVDDGGWYHLGTYDFDAGAGSVSITYHVTDNSQDRVCADAIKFVSTATSKLDITRAHYYVWSSEENKPYLIVLDGDIKYYAFNDEDGDDIVDAGELWPTSSPPSDVEVSDYIEARQNFANWYQFYRRRELTATCSIAKVIASMQGVQIGIRTINGNLVQPVLKVKVEGDDESSTLLNNLYNLVLKKEGTPLRRGLEYVGKYFKGDNPSGLGASPFADAAQGGECQQAFAVVMTDGYWNGDDPAVDNEDGDGDTDFDGSPYGDTYSETLADVAMYYYENDLSSTLGNKVPTTDLDSATHQHMVTYSVSFGVSGTLNPDDYDIEGGSFPTWPNPGDKYYSGPEKIDDLYHAAVNGRGTFLSASRPDDLVNSLLSIMQHIESRIASASAVSVNGDELYEKLGANILMFQASYNSDGWTGDVRAYGIDTGTGEVITTSYRWSAKDELETANWDTGRIIATSNGTSGIPFRYGSLSATQQGQLNADPTTAESILNYIRGDDSNEETNGGPFRDRYWRLGDLVHSSPVFVNGVLYTGGNDGMLHAFSADDGTELFAYVPNLVFENLSLLADTGYTHHYYVDLTPTVKEIPPLNKTVLVGGLEKGGRGYYALDVTNAASINPDSSTDSAVASRFLWEYGNDDDLGYSFSKPVIVDSYDSSVGWVVIFGNGYSSVNEHAVLYVLNPITGQVIKKIDTGVANCNGLSTPVAIDVDMDQKVDYVYAGDLKGNLWKFDFTSPGSGSWGVAYKDGSNNPQPVFQAKDALGAVQPITAKPDVMLHCEKDGYIVLFATGSYLGETDVSDTSTQTIYGIWDYGDDTDDSEYLGSFERGSTPELSNQPDMVTMLEQTEVDYGAYSGQNLRTLSDNDASWETEEDGDEDQLDNPSSTVATNAGWYFDLPISGERVVVDVMIREDKAVVVSFYPETAPCGSGGYSIVHEIDACTGARLTEPQFDINNNGVIDEGDLINIGTEENPIMVAPSGTEREGRLQPPAILRMGQTEVKYFSSSSGTIATVMEQAVSLGITSWREYSQ